MQKNMVRFHMGTNLEVFIDRRWYPIDEKNLLIVLGNVTKGYPIQFAKQRSSKANGKAKG